MSTLDDLRETLADRAGGLTDHDQHTRPGAVHHRVGVVRRKRRAVGGAAAVVVLIAGGLGLAAATVDRDPVLRPAGGPGVIAEVAMPDHEDVGGFDYAFESGSDLAVEDGGGTLVLPPVSGDRAVAFAAHGLGDGVATLFWKDQPIARLRGSESYDVPVPVDSGRGRLRVSVSGAPSGAQAGFGVYRRTDAMPPGVVSGASVFPATHDGQPLLAGAFGAPDRTSFDVTYELATPRVVEDAVYCQAPSAYFLAWSLDGQDDGSISCDPGPREDAASGTVRLDVPTPAGHHVLHVRLIRGAAGPEADTMPPSALIGVGVYGSDVVAVLGSGQPRTIVRDGRTWVLDHVDQRPRSGADEQTTTVDTATGDRYVIGAYSGRELTCEIAGRTTSPDCTGGYQEEAGPGSFAGTVLLEGDDYTVTTHGGQTTYRWALLIYRPA